MTMRLQRAYNNYRSVWANKAPEVVAVEIQLIKKRFDLLEKYRHRDDLPPADKLTILEGIYHEQSTKIDRNSGTGGCR